MKFQAQTELATIQCAHCGMTFAMPSKFMEQRRDDHESLFCPAGHRQYFPQKSEVEIAKEREAAARREAERLRGCIDHKRKVIRSKEYQVRHYKGELTKIKKRVAA